MSTNKKIIIAMVFLALFSVSEAGQMAYGADEQAQEKEEIEEKIASFLGAPEQPAIVGEARPYTLGNEDILQIIVRNQPEFSGQFVIGPDGKIQYAFVGDIEAAGLIKEQLKERLVKELQRFVKVPEVSIAITAYRSKNVYVMGALASPGKYPMKGDSISLRDAIIGAGLPTQEAALKRVHIIKSDPKDPTSRKVNLYAILYKGKLEENIDLMPGDIVVVPTTVYSKVTKMLDALLSPVTKAAVVNSLVNGGIF